MAHRGETAPLMSVNEGDGEGTLGTGHGSTSAKDSGGRLHSIGARGSSVVAHAPTCQHANMPRVC